MSAAQPCHSNAAVTMTKSDFRRLAKSRGMMIDTPTYRALERVLVFGARPTHAARAEGLHTSSVTRALKRITA